jgi:hypothetical protein
VNELEKKLLQSMVGEKVPRLCLKTETRADTGRWLRHSSVWLAVTAEHLVVLAVARRQYAQAIPLAECVESTYCHATGALVIAPTENLEINRLAMTPADALRVLEILNNRNER